MIKTGMIAMALALALTVCAAAFAEEDCRFTGEWSSTKMQIAERVYTPMWVTLNFYDMKDGDGYCRILKEDERGETESTMAVRVAENLMSLTGADGETKTYEVVWQDSGSFTLVSSEGRTLFTRTITTI